MTDLHKSTRLGDLLIEQGVISRAQLIQAIGIQQQRRLRELQHNELTNEKKELGEILIELGFIDRRQLHFSLSWQRRLRKTTAVMIFVAPLLTAACGGGGGEDSSSDTPAVAAAQSSHMLSSSARSVSSSPSMQSSSAVSSASTQLNGPVQLYWATPIQRENGDLLNITDIGGYELRYKLKGDADYTIIQIEDGYADSWYFDHLQGDYEFEIATYDTNGLYSNFVSINPS